MIRKPYPSNVPNGVCRALDDLTEEEIDTLAAFWSDTGLFLYIAMRADDGRAMSPASKEKLDALDVLTKQYREEIETMAKDEITKVRFGIANRLRKRRTEEDNAKVYLG